MAVERKDGTAMGPQLSFCKLRAQKPACKYVQKLLHVSAAQCRHSDEKHTAPLVITLENSIYSMLLCMFGYVYVHRQPMPYSYVFYTLHTFWHVRTGIGNFHLHFGVPQAHISNQT